MKNYLSLAFLLSGVLVTNLAFASQPIVLATCPTKLIPQSDNTYISNEYPGWRSAGAPNFEAPPLDGSHFLRATMSYAGTDGYQVTCIYRVGFNGLDVVMGMDKSVPGIAQVVPQNWTNGQCFQEGVSGITACAFEVFPEKQKV